MCLSIVTVYPEINVLTQEIKACVIQFCMKILKTSYPIMKKITDN